MSGGANDWPWKGARGARRAWIEDHEADGTLPECPYANEAWCYVVELVDDESNLLATDVIRMYCGECLDASDVVELAAEYFENPPHRCTLPGNRIRVHGPYSLSTPSLQVYL